MVEMFSQMVVPFFLFSLIHLFIILLFHHKYYIRLYRQMVDRYKSLIGSQLVPTQIDRNIKNKPNENYNRQIVQRTNAHATTMREYISKYKKDVTQEADTYIRSFKQKQVNFAEDRNLLKNQMEKLQKDKKSDTDEYNFMKRELLRAVKTEIQLELQLNQIITKRKEQQQMLKEKLFKGSVQLSNALKDIQAKKQQIIYLQKSINQCLQLLEIIGILTNETGQKLDDIHQRIKGALNDIQKAEQNIDKAVIASQKSRCKMCIIILLSLVIIIIILVVLFVFKVGNI